ncbi:uncharacterized protein [Ptychodera flava]|uniref:uncharacterized protein n=1 Tax=Ptychodera flava TaxID=63121 RepID=UPI00396A12C3
MKTGFILFCLVVLFRTSYTLWPYPWHAQCEVDWSFLENCTYIKTKIVDQLKKWTGADNCQSGGQKCLYELIYSNDTYIEATHTTPVKKYIDDMTFELCFEGSSCHVKGFSRSRLWYAILDYGTNYCNLHNIISGAGLLQLPGYTEDTKNKICTQFATADCDIY